MIEQQLLVKTNDFRESIFLLIAVHYVFDLEYDSAVGDTSLFKSLCVIWKEEKLSILLSIQPSQRGFII